MKLKTNLTRKPAPGGVFNCKAINIRERLLRFLLGDMHKVTVLIPGDNAINIRERLLRFLLGDMHKVTVLIPGDNVGEILICKSGEKLNEKSQTKTDANL